MAPRFSGTPQSQPQTKKPRFSGKPVETEKPTEAEQRAMYRPGTVPSTAPAMRPRGAVSIDELLADAPPDPNAAPSNVEAVLDLIKSSPSSIAKLITETIGAPLSVARMDSIDAPPEDMPWYRKTVPQLLGYEDYARPAREALAGGQDAVRGAIEENLPQPQYSAGKVADEALQWLAPAAAAPGKAARVKKGFEKAFQIGGDVITQGALPWAAYEATKHYVNNDIAAVLAALTTGVGTSAARSVKSPEALLARDYRGTTDQAWDALTRLQDEQKALGLDITPAEAHAQVTRQTQSGPLQTQRYLEATPIGQLKAGPLLANRGNQVEQGLNQVLDQIAPRSSDPHMIGPQIAEGAENVIRSVEGQRTAAEQPHYRAADPTDVNPQELDAFIANLDAEIAQYTPDNVHRQVLEQFRNRFVQTPARPGAPASVHAGTGQPVPARPGTPEALAYDRRNLDSIKKEFREATKQGQVGQQGTKANIKGIIGRHLDELDAILKEEGANTPSQGALDYRTGVDTHANFTDFILDPLKQGPIGDFSRAKTTGAVGNIMLPAKPTANDVPAMVEALTRLKQETAALPAAARQKIDQLFMDLGGKTRSANREWTGADLAKELAGSPAQRARTQAVLESIGAGDAASNLDRRIEGWQATGKRLPPNSATAQNLQRSAELQQTLPGDVAGSISAGKPWSFIGDLYRAYALSTGQKRASEYAFGSARDARGAAATDWMQVLPEALNRTGLSALFDYFTPDSEQRR